MKLNKVNLKIKKYKAKELDLGSQRLLAKLLVHKLTGKELRHSKTGRPFVSRDLDVSISHKDKIVCVATIRSPYRIGIDVENLNINLNINNFFGSIIARDEELFLIKFCKRKKISQTSGVVTLWSIKESFFKCLDYDLKPGKLSIKNILNNGRVFLNFPDDIRALIKKRGLVYCFTKIQFFEEYVCSETIMKKIN